MTTGGGIAYLYDNELTCVSAMTIMGHAPMTLVTARSTRAQWSPDEGLDGILANAFVPYDRVQFTLVGGVISHPAEDHWEACYMEDPR